MKKNKSYWIISIGIAIILGTIYSTLAPVIFPYKSIKQRFNNDFNCLMTKANYKYGNVYYVLDNIDHPQIDSIKCIRYKEAKETIDYYKRIDKIKCK